MHAWVQKCYPVLGLGSGERLLGHFQTQSSALDKFQFSISRNAASYGSSLHVAGWRRNQTGTAIRLSRLRNQNRRSRLPATEIGTVLFLSICQRAKNGGLDPSWLNLGFLGRPDFQSRVPKNACFKGFGNSGLKIGAPQKRQIQPRRIQPPILGPLNLKPC